MSSAQLKFAGLEDLKRELRNLPEALRAEALTYVHEATDGSAAELKVAYPERTYGRSDRRGSLKHGVRVEYPSSLVAVGKVKTAPHAHLYEFGTQLRHTARGANRGAEPPHPTAIPIYTRHRRQMYEQLLAMLGRQGFQVRGG